MLPNFLIIGAARSGTSTLYYQLQQHPDVYLPRNKRPEPHFFFKAAEYEKGLHYYSERYFSQWNGETAVGEASTSYLFGERTPQLVASALPEVQLIVMLRNPIERAHSNYWHTVASGLEKLDFVEAIASEDERTAGLAATPLEEIRPFSYMARGLYWKQIKNWLKYFDRPQMHFVIFDDFKVNPKASIYGVLDFLELSDKGLEVDFTRIENKAVSKEAEIPESTRETMRRYFEKDVEDLGLFLGRNLSNWLK